MKELHGAVVPNTVGGLMDMLSGIPRSMPLAIVSARLDERKKVVNDPALLMDIESQKDLYTGLPMLVVLRMFS